MEVIQILDRIRNYRQNYPEKYKRICDRLDEILEGNANDATHRGISGVSVLDGLNHEESEDAETLEKLILLDEQNRKYWTAVERARKNPETENHYKDFQQHTPKERKLDFSLARTLFTSGDPEAIFTRMCLYNSPDKVVANLTRNSNRREFLYNLRAKYSLPLPDFLHVKTEQKLDNLKTYQQNRDSLKGLQAVLWEPEIVTQNDGDDDDERPSSLLEVDHRPSATELLLEDPGHPDVTDEPVERRLSLMERVMSSISVTVEEIEESMRRSVSPDQTRTPGEVVSDDLVVAAAKERLRKLYLVFEESDTDDEPGLNIDEFKVAMRRIGGEEMTDREIELTFMKVDANCDGNVDWNEFLEFTLREFQERDIMTQLTRDLFCDGLPNLLYQGSRQIQAMVWVSASAAHSPKSVDHHAGRYYSVTVEGIVKCWTTEFKQAGSNDFILIPNYKQATCFERVNDVVSMPEIRAIVVAFSTSVIRFYYADESRLEEFCMIYGLASPASCFSYVFREDISILSFGDHSGKVQALRFKNLFYDGFWTGLGIGQPANNQVSWATLKKLDKSVQMEATKKVGFINQIKYIPDLNLILTCTSDPTYSLNFISILSNRPRLHISNPDGGFDCFEYHHEMHLIATGGKDHALRIWQPDRLDRPAMQFHNHGGSVDKVHLVKDHKFQVAISIDALRTIRLFDLREQALHQEFHCPINGVERGVVGFIHHNRATEQIFYGGTEILMVHRRSPKHSHHHANHVITHKQPVVAALYNDLFDCIVSGGQDSSIIVWNCVDGEKIIQFFNAHTEMDHGKMVALPIRKMTFDSSRRRLLTVGEDNLIKMWNFNNGACLSKFTHMERVVLNDIGYHKNRDLVMAAGFNASIFMVRDTRGEDEVEETEYKWQRLHRSDITTFQVRYPVEVVEPTESEKIARSIRHTPSTKSTRSNFSHREHPSSHADGMHSHHSSVHPAASALSSRSNFSHREDPSGHLDVEPSEQSSESEVDEKLLDDGSVLFSASYDGEIVQWDVFTGRPIFFLNSDLSPSILSPAQRAEHISPCTFGIPHVSPKDSGNLEAFFGVQHRRATKIHRRMTALRGDNADNKEPNFTIHPVAPPTRDAVTCMVLLEKRAREDANVATLFTSSADGFLRGWSTCFPGGGLKALFHGGHSIGSYVLHACTDDHNELLFTADSSGYVKIWFICEWVNREKSPDRRHEFDPRCFPALRRYKLFGPALARHATRIMGMSVPLLDKRHQPFYNAPLVLNSFRAHTAAINHISIVQKRGIIITASRDCSVRLWTYSGLYIATLGQHEPYHVDVEKLHIQSVKEGEERKDREGDGELSGEEVEERVKEEDSDDETFMKPRVVVPPDIRQHGSLMTLNVVRNLKFRSWKEACNEKCDINPEVKKKEEELLQPSELTHLDVRNHNSPDFQYDKFLFLGYVSPIGYTYGEAEVYTNIESQPMRHYHNIEEVLPNCILDYNIEKVQTDWINRLPKWQRAEFILLQKEGNLYGNNLRQLITLVRKETRRSQNQDPNSSVQKESANKEAMKLEVEEQRVVDALQRVGAEARPTLVDFLLEPPRKDFLANMLYQDAQDEPHIPLKSPEETMYRVLMEERTRQVKPFVPIVARNMHLLTELQVLDKQAHLRKRPSKTQQILLRPSRTLVDVVQHIHRVDQYSNKHPVLNRVFGSPKIYSRRKQPKVPDIRKNYPVMQKTPESIAIKTENRFPVSETNTELSLVSSDCSIKSDIAGDFEHIWIEIDDKHKETFSVAEAWHAHVLNPHIAIHTAHRAPVTVRKAMRRFLRDKPLLKNANRF